MKLLVLPLLLLCGCRDWDALGACVPEGKRICASTPEKKPCGVCPGVCVDDGAGGTACKCGGASPRIAIDELWIDVEPGAPEGVYECYAPEVAPAVGELRDPSPCEAFFTPHKAPAFYLAPDDGAEHSLQAFYWCSGGGRHFLSTDKGCGDLGQAGLVNTGIVGYLASEPVCGAVGVHRLAETAHDNDRAYVTTQIEIDTATAAPSGYDQGKPYLDEGVVGYVWSSP
jgi:hypothetical protein